jgi:site-specific recombinase XerD
MHATDGRSLAILAAEESMRPPARHVRGLLTRDEIRQLLGACSERASTGLRNRALIASVYRGGLRLSDTLALTELAIDREGRLLRSSRSPRGCVALDAGSFRIIEAWIARRRELQIPVQAPLFCTLHGGPLCPSYVRALFTRLRAKTRIDKQVSAEALRRALAAELAREGVPIGVIQAQLGHQSTTTTERYVTRAAPHDLVEAMRKREDWLF